MGLSLPAPSAMRHASFGIGSPVLREALPTAALTRSAHRPRGGSSASDPPESLARAAEAISNCPRPISVPIRRSTHSELKPQRLNEYVSKASILRNDVF